METISLEKQLTEEFKVSKEAIEFYQEFGYVKLKHVLSPEVIDYYGKIITDLVVKLNTNQKPMEERTTFEKAFLQVANLWREDEKVKEFVFSKRLAKIAADLMKVDGVRIYHDQALYKESGGGITPWHADQFYMPLADEKICTVWIPLQETPVEMGPLAFAEKSQIVNVGRDMEIGDESEVYIAQEIEKLKFKINNTKYDLGEVSFHAGWTLHRAGPNVSGSTRNVMTIIYIHENMRVGTPVHKYHFEDIEKWCKVKVGEIIDNPITPILYKRNK